MNLDEVQGHEIAAAAVHCVELTSDRTPLYRALLREPVAVALLGPHPPPGPTLKVGDSGGDNTRLFESVALRASVAALFCSAAQLRQVAAERGLWSDGVERARVYPAGTIFARLKTHPGALLITPDAQVPFDTGEVAALADKLTPMDFVTALRALITAGRPREAARRLATRSLYLLAHPQGGIIKFEGQRELPVFLHQLQAEMLANRIAEQMGRKPEFAVVAASEVFQYALRGRLAVLIDPGPRSLKLRPIDLR